MSNNLVLNLFWKTIQCPKCGTRREAEGMTTGIEWKFGDENVRCRSPPTDTLHSLMLQPFDNVTRWKCRDKDVARSLYKWECRERDWWEYRQREVGLHF